MLRFVSDGISLATERFIATTSPCSRSVSRSARKFQSVCRSVNRVRSLAVIVLSCLFVGLQDQPWSEWHEVRLSWTRLPTPHGRRIFIPSGLGHFHLRTRG